MAGRGHMSEVDSDLLILKDRLMGYVNVGMDNTIDVAQNVAEYCGDDEELKRAAKDIMQDFIKMQHDIQQHVKALTHIKSVGTDTGLASVFKDKLQQVRASENHNVKDHPKYVELEQLLSDDGNIDEQLDSLRAVLVGTAEDEEVVMTSVEIKTKCPFTGQTMVNPVRNKICNHVYDRDGIMSYISSRKAKAKCPVGGCDNTSPITPESLEDHKDMKKYITLLAKRNL